MKTKIKIILLALCLPLLSVAQQQTKYGYMVCIDNKGERLEIVKTPDILEVVTLAEVQFPNNCIDFREELRQYPPVFTLDNNRKVFYVEMKRINKNGKYRRIGKREYKQMLESTKQ